jgi:alpha-L-arabinofuranosidase
VFTLAGNPEDSYSSSHPRNIVPVTTPPHGIKPGFTYTIPPTSIVVIRLKAH